MPREAQLRTYANGMVMDPSHPYTLERVREDTARLRAWGYGRDIRSFDWTSFYDGARTNISWME